MNAVKVFIMTMLPDVVDDLKAKGLAVESDGAICVFPPGFKTKEGNPMPLIVQKSDGAFLYATTDLAAIRYRVTELGAKEIIYVTDARQSLHFEMVFAVARMAGWVPDDVELVHVTFGSVLGENGKPLKTRSGENVKLKELLDEAVARAKSVVEQKNPDLPPEKKMKLPKPSASALSNMPTTRITAPAIIFSASTRCSPWKATPPLTCSMPTPA